MLKEKVAVITGSNRGIGRTIALTFAKQGAKVVINCPYENFLDAANEVVNEIIALGGEAIAVVANIANFEESKKLIDMTIEKFGKIDILVNNAGITRDMLLLRMTEQEFDDVINVNLKGAFNCTKHAVRPMMKSGGSIINMTSVSGLSGNAGQVNYSAAKAGLVGLTKSTAKEFAKKNIRVNAIAPGFIDTEMTQGLTDELKKEINKNIPLKRMGSVEEVANVALFLASNLASYVTGEIIRVDGGMIM
ncbi:3-oxoacyl-[acyl-carrier-protein] reductase [Candidatus Epulonipiscium fishelsonii]|uniref:3-oxoacyl-[acyl-carrier-protein] reductase n=1 Tax=Candidatus Epulonipiscium fishelsonii TaxID=77094 RepID=A0ACC8X9B3_9FIRM|nr:3-oxoacyl-[acyl-carrier-protein] reductase [Epulopiscium sp. SCG-D08WGA-EpuloA1]